jgi:hypothetical protein
MGTLIRKYRAGTVVPPESALEMAEAIRQDVLRKEDFSEGREKLLTLFDLSKNIDEFLIRHFQRGCEEGLMVRGQDRKEDDTLATKEERKAWSRRAEASGLSLKGVLYKNLPEVLNRVIHEYHRKIVLQGLENAGNKVALLEAGSGFGRISVEIRRQSPHWRLVGVDSSWEFIRRYARYVSGETVGTQGDILWLPFRSESFDAVVVVTCLMYLPGHLRCQGIEEIFRVARKGAPVVLVEPGLMAQRLYSGFGVMHFLKTEPRGESFRTGGVGYRVHEFLDCIRMCQGTVLACRGNPGFTLMLTPLLFAARWCPRLWFDRLCALSALLDRSLQKHLALSTHIGVVAKKENLK